jgi:drug/metabolite transporter (DMT)-like permease
MNDQRRGLSLGIAGYCLLTGGDAVIKSMAGEWPVTAVSVLRFAIGALALGGIILVREGRSGFAVPRPIMQVARGVSLAFASLLFFASLQFMPLAEATVISFAAPIVIALLSGWWFSERIGRVNWLAMVLATMGVIIVLRPNVAEYGLPALLPILAMLAMSVFVILNRLTAEHVSPIASQFWVALYAVPIQLVLAVVGHISGQPALVIDSVPEWHVLLRCVLVAATASCAHMLLFMATRHVSAAKMAPTSYVQIIMAMIFGAFLFSDYPDATALAGMALIVVAGLALWYANGTQRTDGNELTP